AVVAIVFLILRPPPCPPIFPYTSLFRSRLPGRAGRTWKPGWRTRQIPDSGFSLFLLTLYSPSRAAILFTAYHHGPHRLARLKLRSEEHTSELQSREKLVCRLLLEKNIHS